MVSLHSLLRLFRFTLEHPKQRWLMLCILFSIPQLCLLSWRPFMHLHLCGVPYSCDTYIAFILYPSKIVVGGSRSTVKQLANLPLWLRIACCMRTPAVPIPIWGAEVLWPTGYQFAAGDYCHLITPECSDPRPMERKGEYFQCFVIQRFMVTSMTKEVEVTHNLVPH